MPNEQELAKAVQFCREAFAGDVEAGSVRYGPMTIAELLKGGTMSEVQRETTIEKIKLPTTTVVEGEPDQPNEVAPEPQPEPEPDQGNSDDPKDRYFGKY